MSPYPHQFLGLVATTRSVVLKGYRFPTRVFDRATARVGWPIGAWANAYIGVKTPLFKPTQMFDCTAEADRPRSHPISLSARAEEAIAVAVTMAAVRVMSFLIFLPLGLSCNFAPASCRNARCARLNLLDLGASN
jgi:hypothetical protein